MSLKINPELSPIDNMIELIKHSVVNPNVNKSKITSDSIQLSTPEPTVDEINNSKIVITGVPALGIVGSKTVTYNRIQLIDTVLMTDSIVSDLDQLRSVIRSDTTSKLSLIVDELVFENPPVQSEDGLSMTIEVSTVPNSLLAYGNCNITVLYQIETGGTDAHSNKPRFITMESGSSREQGGEEA